MVPGEESGEARSASWRVGGGEEGGQVLHSVGQGHGFPQ